MGMMTDMMGAVRDSMQALAGVSVVLHGTNIEDETVEAVMVSAAGGFEEERDEGGRDVQTYRTVTLSPAVLSHPVDRYTAVTIDGVKWSIRQPAEREGDVRVVLRVVRRQAAERARPGIREEPYSDYRGRQ